MGIFGPKFGYFQFQSLNIGSFPVPVRSGTVQSIKVVDDRESNCYL